MVNPFAAMWNRLTKTENNDTFPRRVPFVRMTQAGVAITPETALKNAVTWACIRYLTNAVAQIPWRVYAEEQDGDAILQPNHPVDWLLRKRPNSEMGAFTWRQTMLGNALRYGNGYSEIERDLAGRPVALWPLHSLRVHPKRRRDTGALYYDVIGEGVADHVELEPMDVFHVRGFGDGPVGFNVVEYAAQTIGWAQATELFGASFFGEGMNPGGIVEIPPTIKLDSAGLSRLKGQMNDLYRGPMKSSRTAFLDAGMKWTKISVQPNDAQFIDTLQFQVDSVCRWFGVPPHKVMHLMRATFSNIEHQSIEVVTDSVVPWVRTFEDEADFKLFGQNRLSLFTRMDLSALLRGDMPSQAAYFKSLRDAGVYSVNEIRAKLGENRIGPEGDKRVAQVNLTTLEKLGEGPPPGGGGAQTPAGDPQSGANDPPGDGEDPQPGGPMNIVRFGG